jgi:hypothetical protein
MAKFTISDFIHLGIDKGVEATEWKVTLDEGGNDIIIHTEQDGPSLTYDGDMRITSYTKQDGTVIDLTNFNNGTGLFWNGETPIWVHVKVVMNGKRSQWFSKEYEYIARTEDGVVIPHRNVLDFDKLEAYTRSSNDKVGE